MSTATQTAQTQRERAERTALEQIAERMVKQFPELPQDEVVRAIQGRYAEFEGSRIRDFVPVLVASNRGETAERVRGLQLGADDYISRPCDPAELLARVRALLRTKQTHDRIRKLQATLEQMVVNDPLTGLHNRRYLMDRLLQEMQRSDRHGEPLAFAMLDLDSFRPINDQYGHVLGDKVLRAVGNAIAKSIRVSDIAARYGGDEFGVILPQTPPEGAMRVCERLLRTISELILQDENGKSCRVTASLGLAYYPADDVETPEDLVHSADGALYGAKRSGKNRFTTVRPVQPVATA